MIDNEKLRLIAAYLGCPCEYEQAKYTYSSDDFRMPPTIESWEPKTSTLSIGLIGRCNDETDCRGLRLNLRQLSGLNDEELCKLWEEDFSEASKNTIDSWRKLTMIEKQFMVWQINYLRSIGVLVDDSIYEFVTT